MISHPAVSSGRINSIDMCRGVLFILMTNTHALGLAQINAIHWARSDLWLPNGWATIVFVVLSGYAAGYLLSEREPEAKRDELLRRRALDILAVMFVSNTAFAALRELARGTTDSIFSFTWYAGFLTLSTEWTISGVLFPTALVLLVAPWVFRGCKIAPFWMISGLLICQLGLTILSQSLKNTPYNDTWIIEFLLLKGFGGFPVAPFLINGCIGIWLGMTHRRNEKSWLPIIGVLTVWQFLIYFSSFTPTSLYWNILFKTTSALGKFGTLFLLATALVRLLPIRLASFIEIIGRHALGSFVMHRVFLQGLLIATGTFITLHFTNTFHYVYLVVTTLFLTWLLCRVREAWPTIDYSFKTLRI